MRLMRKGSFFMEKMLGRVKMRERKKQTKETKERMQKDKRENKTRKC